MGRREIDVRCRWGPQLWKASDELQKEPRSRNHLSLRRYVQYGPLVGVTPRARRGGHGFPRYLNPAPCVINISIIPVITLGAAFSLASVPLFAWVLPDFMSSVLRQSHDSD